MADLRYILAQGRKRIGLLLGAGAPGKDLIPTVAGLTSRVLGALDSESRKSVEVVRQDLGNDPNIEQILSRIRALADAIGSSKVHGLDGTAYRKLAGKICEEIGAIVSCKLPESHPYSEVVTWTAGIARDHAVEIFTPNYDLLLEEAFERARIPYFDGFTGSREPFFDPASVTSPELPARWARLWKLHGSLGWKRGEAGEVTRGGDDSATEFIYPTHLKYDETQKLPYRAFLERLRSFVQEPDSMLLTCGFSFEDRHLKSTIEEGLSLSSNSAVLAFQYSELSNQSAALGVAKRRPNLSVYARDAAMINCVAAEWVPGDLPNNAWKPIRDSYWNAPPGSTTPHFRLGDFSEFARYLALVRVDQRGGPESEDTEVPG